jgi:type I restriction enzyme S subunit
MGSEWTEKTWGELATLEYGKALIGYEQSSGKYCVYGTNGPIGWTDSYLYTKPSVIIGRKGAYRGVHFTEKPFFVIDTAFYLKPKTEFDMRWAYYQLLTQNINAMDSGSAIPSTSRQDFYGLPLLFPPIDEQVAIAQLLGSLERKIALNQRMNKTLEAMAQALFNSWFVDFDPVKAKAEGRGPEGMNDAIAALFPSAFTESIPGPIPEGWEISEIGKEVEVVGGSTPSTQESAYWEDGRFYWVTPKDLSKLKSPILLDTERKITEFGVKQISSAQLPIDTVLLSSRAPVGYIALAKVPVSINQGFIAI